MIEHVAIVGAGFSGTLQAINLLRHGGPRATLIEGAGAAGKGLAFGAAHPSHLLNVRAGNMSAFPDDPGHFVRWLDARGTVDAGLTFVQRLTYGTYLSELLADARRAGAGRLDIVTGKVVDAPDTTTGVTLHLADGRVLAADAAVLAIGNLAPHDPSGLNAGDWSPSRYFGDPWDPAVADNLADADTVLMIGSGLTMIDVALMLDARQFRGRIVALSRRGLMPRCHGAAVPAADKRRERPPTVGSSLVAQVRSRSGAIGWRTAVDELRPFTQAMWANASDTERARFLRHLRPWWDVHRHRLAPAVADRIAAMQIEGRLTIVAGKTVAFAEEDGGIAVSWRRRGTDEAQTLHAQRIVNCTGPQSDLARTDDPLLRAMLDRGTIRPDAAHLGIDVDAQAAVIAVDGSSSDRLFALGPMTRGAFWEIVAVPDIRSQTWTLARRLSNAHWVGGEGL